MNHLSDEQLEQIMLDKNSVPEHVNHCAQCRNRLAEKVALAQRLRSAFISIKPPEELRVQICQKLRENSSGSKFNSTSYILSFHNQRRELLAVAAAVLVIAIPLVMYLSAPSSVVAAQAELVKIHEHNLMANHEFHSESDPNKLAEYFRDKLGFSPSMPHPGQGLALRGCCVRHFRGQIVGSYVVETPAGIMSVIVVTDLPESLGWARKIQRGEHTFWESSFAKCDMVTVRLGKYSYCAVGEISHAYLSELLERLLNNSKS